MSKVREPLRAFLGKRIKVRGQLAELKDDFRGIRACITNPEMDGDLLSDHIWVVKCPHWLRFRATVGNNVEFEAVVNEYQKPDGRKNFGLCKPSNPRLIRPAKMAIPDSCRKKRSKRPPIHADMPAGSHHNK